MSSAKLKNYDVCADCSATGIYEYINTLSHTIENFNN